MLAGEMYRDDGPNQKNTSSSLLSDSAITIQFVIFTGLTLKTNRF
jgi:hypothetical protein